MWVKYAETILYSCRQKLKWTLLRISLDISKKYSEVPNNRLDPDNHVGRNFLFIYYVKTSIKNIRFCCKFISNLRVSIKTNVFSNKKQKNPFQIIHAPKCGLYTIPTVHKTGPAATYCYSEWRNLKCDSGHHQVCLYFRQVSNSWHCSVIIAFNK